MADERYSLVAAVYSSKGEAETTIDMLERMHRAVSISLRDAAVITKDASGKIHINETGDLGGGEGAVRGAIVGGVLGLIFPPSLLVTGLLGGAIGGLLAKFVDRGIDNDELKTLAERIEPGQAAVVAFVSESSLPTAQASLQGFEGELLVQPVSDETMQQLFKAESSNRTATGDTPSFG